jgi:hypothetical protein
LDLLVVEENPDPVVKENIIWLVSAMIEQSYLDSIVELLSNSTIIKILHDQIKETTSERILL